jgi:hypothetical protein
MAFTLHAAGMCKEDSEIILYVRKSCALNAKTRLL